MTRLLSFRALPGFVQRHWSDNETRIFVAVIAIAALLFLLKLGDLPLLSYNEARRALAIEQMVNSGNWLIPYRNGEIYITKPPLFYWLGAISETVFGRQNEWALRLPNALLGIGLVASVFLFVKSRSDTGTAAIAALLLTLNASIAELARQAEIELLLTALITWSLLLAFRYLFGAQRRRDLLLSYTFLGLGFLAKGPLCLLFVTLPIAVFALLNRDNVAWRYLRHGGGWAIALLLGASWYVAVIEQLGWTQFNAIISHDIVDKIVRPQADPWYAYLLWIVSDFLPASVLLAIHFRRVKPALNMLRERLLIVLAVLIPLLLYSLFAAKNSKYLAPIYPMLAIVFALVLRQVYLAAGQRGKKRLLALTVLMSVLYLSYYAVAQASILRYRYTALLELKQWHQRLPALPIYGHPAIDERAIYYVGGRVAQWPEPYVASALPTDYLLLVDQRPLALPQSVCPLAVLQPYLKKTRQLALYGHGKICASIIATQGREK